MGVDFLYPDELSNLQTLCSDCNLNKSDVIQ